MGGRTPDLPIPGHRDHMDREAALPGEYQFVPKTEKAHNLSSMTWGFSNNFLWIYPAPLDVEEQDTSIGRCFR